MEVQIREKCPHCDNGYVYSPSWAEWGREFDRVTNHITPFSAKCKAEAEYVKDHPVPEEPEEHPCPDCEGTQWLYRWVPVAELLSPHLRRVYDTIAGV